MAKKSLIVKSQRDPKYQLACLQSLQGVWSFAGVHAEVRCLPDLLPGTGLVWPTSRCDQVQLVTST